MNEPFEVSIPTDESIIARKVYHNCIVYVFDCDSLVELIKQEMVEYDVVMGMDWLTSC